MVHDEVFRTTRQLSLTNLGNIFIIRLKIGYMFVREVVFIFYCHHAYSMYGEQIEKDKIIETDNRGSNSG